MPALNPKTVTFPLGMKKMAEEAPRAEIAKSAKPSVLQKLHSYSVQSQTEPKKSVEEYDEYG